MAARQRDVKVRILSEYYDAGSKAAERATRRLASIQMAAAAEDVNREQARAQAIIAANSAQMASMQQVGRVTLGLSAAIAVGLGLAAKAAMDWESAWAGVRKTVDGSPEEMAALEADLRGLALVLPATHEAIAGVAEVAGQLGVARGDIAAFTRTAIDMGETTNVAADEAATSMAQLSNIMGIGADQASRMGSAIVDLGNNGASTERDILAMSLRIAGAGRTVGMTTDQVLGISSALASVGMEVEAGGTAISRVLIKIDKDVSSGADTLETYARVSGVSVAEFTRAWREDAASALTGFVGGLGRLQKAGGDVNGTLDDLGYTEVRVSDALRRAALAGDLLTDAIETGNRAWDENIALTEEANKRYQTTEARLQIARNQINDTAIDVGGNLLPVLADAADWVGSLAVGFGALPEPVQQWAAQLGMAALGLTAVIGGAAIVIPKLRALQDTVLALRGGSSLLGRSLGGVTRVLTGPWGLAIAGAVTVLGLWVKSQGDAKRTAQEVADTLDRQTAEVTDNTRAWALNELVASDTADKARELGIDMRDLVDAAIDPAGDAARRLTTMLEDLRTQAAANAAQNREDSEGWSILGTSVADVGTDSIKLMAILRELGVIQGDVAAGQQLQRDRIEAGITSTEDATDAHDIYNAVLRDGNQLLEDGAAAVDELARALEDLNGPALDAEAAESRYQEALDGVGEALEQQISELARQYEQSGMSARAARERAEAEVAAADKLDLSTEAGRRNRAALRDIAEETMNRANALLELTGDEEAWRTAIDEGRQALHDSAIQMGMSEEAAWAYVESVLAIPAEAAVRATFDAVAAEQQMQAFVDHWSGYQIPISATMNPDQALAAIQRVQRRAGASVMEAGGGLLEFYAGGGMRESHVAQIAPAGATRIWREPETGGEGYVPLANDWRRPRAEAVVGELASRFGGAFLTKADLVALAGSRGSVVATAGQVGTVDLSDRSVEQLASAILAGAGAQAGAVVAGAQADRASVLRGGIR